MAKKRKNAPKWEERIDVTRIAGKTGRMRIAYKWFVRRGKYKQFGTCTSREKAVEERAAAKERIKEARSTGDKRKANKPIKLGNFL